MIWTILVLLLGIALYVFSGTLVKQNAKKVSAVAVYLKKAVNVVAALLIAGSVCRLYVPYYLTDVNPVILQEMVESMQKQQNAEKNKTVRKYVRSHGDEMSADAPDTKEERNSWGKGPVLPGGRVPELFAKYENLYGDLSANSAGQAIMRDPEFGLQFLETYTDRLFFATDMVNTDMVFPLGAWLDEQVKLGNLSQDAYEKICWKNAQRVFGL